MEPNRSTDNTTFHAFFLRRLIIIWLFMEIRIKAYAYTIDIITEIRYFCKCNNAVFGKFRIIFTCAISKTDCSLHHNFHALFKISGNGKFVCTAVLTPHPSRNLRKSTPRPRPAPPHQPFQKPHYPSKIANTLASLVKGEVLSPEKIRATTGGIATPLLPKPHYPLLCTTFLPYERSVGFASHCLVSH